MANRGTGGHLVNLASCAAWTPTAPLPAYSATKAAVRMLSECLRAELAPAGIGVTAICPGFTSTGIAAAARYLGTGGSADPDAVRSAAVAGLARRAFPADNVALAVMRAVLADKPVVPVNAEARVTYALSRLSPALLRKLAASLDKAAQRLGR
jgi:short-subunit dehydrogenase